MNGPHSRRSPHSENRTERRLPRLPYMYAWWVGGEEADAPGTVGARLLKMVIVLAAPRIVAGDGGMRAEQRAKKNGERRP